MHRSEISELLRIAPPFCFATWRWAFSSIVCSVHILPK
uniref:Uncharacterized protein n=1 Tax=Anguilla anguilla TaxID=7936 RepID=A0A0E9Q5W1_ANGAN